MKAPILEPAQWEEAFARCEAMDRPAMYRFLLLVVKELGLRPKELAGMKAAWFRNGELRVPAGHSKGKSSRSLPYSAEIEVALYEHLRADEAQGLRSSQHVFHNQQGQPFLPGGMSYAVARCLKRAVGTGSAYSGRRGKGQAMQDAGANILTLQAFFGHKSPLTTMEYVGCSQAQLRRAMFA